VTLRPTFIDAAASLQIRTAAGAEILFDNASRGVAGIDGTMLIPNVDPGRHDVRVLMPGRPAFRQTANVGAGQEMIIEARLDDLDLVQPSSAPITAPRIAGNDRFLLFHFVVGGGWHFGILTVSRNHIEWTETATAEYSFGRIGGFANAQHIEPGSAADNFVVTCTEILDVGNNLVASGEHVRLKSRNYDLSPAVTDKDGKQVPKANSPIPGLDKAAADACPGSVK